MKPLINILFLLFFCTSGAALGQAPTEQALTQIKGVVVSTKGEPLIGVNLQIEGTYDGAATDIDGLFSFNTSAQDSQTLVVNYFGYQEEYCQLDLRNKEEIGNLKITYKEKSIQLDEIIIREVREFKSTDKARTTVLATLDVLTVASDGDIQSAFKTFPGVQPIAESGGLFIRGGTGEETQAFVDGMRIDRFTYSSPSNVGAQSRFSPKMFKGMYLSNGNYSALYGQALSSALILETVDLPVKSSIDFGVSPLFAEASGQFLSKDEKSTAGASLNYTNGALVLNNVPTNIDFSKPQENLNTNYNYKREIGEGGMLKYYGSSTYSKVGVLYPNLDDPTVEDETNVKNSSFFNQLTYKQTFKSDWALSLGTSHLKNTDHFTFTSKEVQDASVLSTTHIKDKTDVFQLRAVATRFLKQAKLHFGGEYHYAQNELSNSDQGSGSAFLKDHYTAAFAEYNRSFTPKLTLSTGVRLEHYSILDEAAIMPRLTLSYTLKKGSLAYASWGEFAQKPQVYDLVQDTNLDLQRSEQYTLGFQKTNNYQSLRVEAYHKKYRNLITYTPEVGSEGYGTAKGVEVFWKDKKSFDAFEYWLSYSLLDTKRKHMDFPIEARPNFAMKHVASLTLKKFVPRIMTNFGVTYTYGSGRPYFNPNRAPEDFLSDRTIDYHNINFNVAYLPKIKNTFSVLVLTVSNVIGNQQVFNYEYSSVDFSKRRPVLPFIKRLVFVGFFVNIGVDRTDDIINRQLN